MISSERLLKKMMAFRPVSEDVASVNSLVDFTGSYLRKAGLKVAFEKLQGRKILYASPHRGKRPDILFNAHLDVVPAGEELFRIRQRGNVIYGRGAGDCLGNCAMLANVLVRTLKDRPDIGAIFSTDEEIGGETTAYMVKRGYGGNFIVILDGGPYRIAVAQKGVVTIKLTAKGISCHGSAPWRGKNAVDALIDGYLMIRKMFPEIKPGDEWHTSMSANIISAGTVFNRVPDRAEMFLDVRHTEKITPARLVRNIKKTSGLGVSVIRKQPVVFCNEKDGRLLKLAGLMKKRLKHRIDMVRMNGATDARHFVKLNSPIAIIGVPGTGAHSDRDRVNIAGIKKYEDMIVELIGSIPD